VPPELHEQRFTVEFEYPVVFCRGALSPGESSLVWCIGRREPERRHPVFVVLDGGLAAARPGISDSLRAYTDAHGRHLELVVPPFEVPGGERVKNDPELIAEIQRRLALARLDKQGTLLIIGGGAVLDAAGYAGSTTHRGVRIVRMPSTVLSQNDAGIGVKTSVNALGSKNFLGTFAPPYAVINDVELLSTLPLRDVRAGLAEAVKVALVRDASFFAWLEEHAAALRDGDEATLETAIRRCAQLHLSHIAGAGDPFERGSARPLDYGHWAAHKLETLSDHELRHGEAVAIGMALDASYAVEKQLLPSSARLRIRAVLGALGLPTYSHWLRANTGSGPAVLQGLREFREHLGGALSVTLLTAVGTGVEVHDMDEGAILRSIDWLEAHRS